MWDFFFLWLQCISHNCCNCNFVSHSCVYFSKNWTLFLLIVTLFLTFGIYFCYFVCVVWPVMLLSCPWCVCVCVSEATSCPCPLWLYISSCDSSPFLARWCHWPAGLFGCPVLEGAVPWKSRRVPTRVCAANLPLNFRYACQCPEQLNSPEWEPETYSSITHSLHKSKGELILMHQCLLYQAIKVWMKSYVSRSAFSHQSLC